MLRYISITLLSLSVLFSVAVADDVATKGKGKGKKGKRGGPNPAMQLISKIEAASVTLTDEQTVAIKAHGKAMVEASQPVRKDHGVDAAAMKSMREARAAAKADGAKRNEIDQIAKEKSGLSDTQLQGIAKLDELRKQMMADVASELTDEQRASLPKNLGGTKGGGKGKGNGKKKNS